MWGVVQEIAWKSPHGPELEGEILALAERQHGHITRQQLLGLGLSRGAIDGRLESGEYVRVHRGVYGIAPRRDGPVSRAAAAVLACGDGAVLSHVSAASLWGFVPRWAVPPEVIARGPRERPGILTHRCPSLKRRDITRQLGVPVTSPPRTILDIAPRLTVKQRTRLVNDARRDGFLHPDSFTDILARNPYHPGARLLRPVRSRPPTNPTRSPFEDDFLAFIQKYRLPTPQINVTVGGREVDAYFPGHHLIVELDGWDYHKDRDAFEDDRERDAENLRHRLNTLRITKQRMTQTPDREAERLQEILQDGLGRPRLLLRTSSRTLTGSSRVGGPIRDRKMCPIQERTRT